MSLFALSLDERLRHAIFVLSCICIELKSALKINSDCYFLATLTGHLSLLKCALMQIDVICLRFSKMRDFAMGRHSLHLLLISVAKWLYV